MNKQMDKFKNIKYLNLWDGAKPALWDKCTAFSTYIRIKKISYR